MNLKTNESLPINASSTVMSLEVGIVQFKGDRAEYYQSQQRLLDAIDSAGEQGVKVLVCPECACSEYSFDSREQAMPFGETLRGTFANQISRSAQRHGLWSFVGVIEVDESGRLFNAVFIFGPSGERHCYRKRMLFDADQLWAESGDIYPAERLNLLSLSDAHIGHLTGDDPPYPLLDIFGWRATVGICMDLNDPRFVKFCEEAKIELIAFPTNWIDQGFDVIPYWAHLLQHVEGVTLLAANSYGLDGEYMLRGHSAILQMSPPTLVGVAPAEGDYLITCQLEHPSLTHKNHNRKESD